MNRIPLPRCARSWIVAVPPECDRHDLRRTLPPLLLDLEAEGVGVTRRGELDGLSARTRAQLAATEISSADEAPHAHLAPLPVH